MEKREIIFTKLYRFNVSKHITLHSIFRFTNYFNINAHSNIHQGRGLLGLSRKEISST